MPWPWKPGYGSVTVIENVTIRYWAYDFLLMFYSNYGSISCRFWDIQCRKILRSWNPSQEPIKVIERGTIRYSGYCFLLVFYSNFVLKTHHFWDIRLQKCRDLEHWIRGLSRSLKMSSFDRADMTSYWRSIVNMALSLVVSEIFDVVKYRDLEITVRGQSRSLKVVPFDTLDMVSY